MIPKYKFINFIKETVQPSNIDLDGNNIKQFYEDLISESSKEPLQRLETITKSEDKIEKKKNINRSENIINKEDIKKLETEFLKASQNNDLKTVERYIKSGHNINVLDMFKWSALMKAVAARNFEIVRLLLENNADVTVEDNSGNNAYKLAVRINDDEIKNLIIKKALSSDDLNEEVDKVDDSNVDENSLEYCEICDKEYLKTREKSHLTSIVHIINENKSENRMNIVNYTLKSTNKGYQMLVRSGWNECTGLGSQEQGRIYPLKATKKEDRYGFGLDKKNKKFQQSHGLLSNLNRKESKSVFKSIKDFKKSSEKFKKFERNFRQYFDS